MNRQLTAVITRYNDGYVALFPDLDIASQGDIVEEARDNLRDALESFIEMTPYEEVEQRLGGEVYVTQAEVTFG